MNTLQSIFQSTQMIVYLSIAGMAMLFLLVSFFFGGGHDHDGEVADHDHDHDHDAGGAHSYSTVSVFSPKVLCIFLLAFGSGGAVASVYGARPHWSVVIALLSGFAVGAVALYSLRLLYSQQANSLVTNADIVGAVGQVTTRIPSGGVGEITFVAARQSTTRLARMANGGELPAGRQAKIMAVSGDALLVEPVA